LDRGGEALEQLFRDGIREPIVQLRSSDRLRQRPIAGRPFGHARSRSRVTVPLFVPPARAAWIRLPIASAACRIGSADRWA
jgi:hypothetical protein